MKEVQLYVIQVLPKRFNFHTIRFHPHSQMLGLHHKTPSCTLWLKVFLNLFAKVRQFWRGRRNRMPVTVPLPTEINHTTMSPPLNSLKVCGFFNVQQNLYVLARLLRRRLRFIVLIRRLEILTVSLCSCVYKGSTFCSVILSPWEPDWKAPIFLK